MRILMTTTGYAGHVLPLVPFARACVRAGHDVRIAGPRSHGAVVRERGLDFCACADPPAEEVARIVASVGGLPAASGHERMIGEGFGRIGARSLLPDLLRIVGAWRPDVVVRESHEFAGYLAAELHGVPHACVGLGLAATEQETRSLVAGHVSELRAELDLAPDPRAERIGSAPYLTLVPRALEAADCRELPATYRFRETRPAGEALPNWWPGGSGPLVYLTFGSVAASLGFFPDLYRRAIEAVSDIGARVLVTVGEAGDPSELGVLPSNVHVERWVPQHVVANHAAAVVCHGGYGSMLSALAHGLPLVVVPLFGGDQWHNARRVAAVGAGIALEEPGRAMLEHPGPDLIAALPGAIERVLADAAYTDAASRIARAIDALPPVEAFPDTLQEIGAQRRAMITE